MVKRASPAKFTDTPPWVNPDVVHDYAEGRTMGEDWNSTEGLVAQLAVMADRERRRADYDIKKTLEVVSCMGLLEFNRFYLRELWMRWWWGARLDDD